MNELLTKKEFPLRDIYDEYRDVEFSFIAHDINKLPTDPNIADRFLVLFIVYGHSLFKWLKNIAMSRSPMLGLAFGAMSEIIKYIAKKFNVEQKDFIKG